MATRNQSDPEWTSSLISGIQAYRRKGLFCDTVLESNDNSIFTAHSCILASASPFLCHQLVQCPLQNYSLKLPVFRQVLECLLDFMYSGEWKIPEDYSEDVCAAARVFGLQSPYPDSSNAMSLRIVSYSSVQIGQVSNESQSSTSVLSGQQLEWNCNEQEDTYPGSFSSRDMETYDRGSDTLGYAGQNPNSREKKLKSKSKGNGKRYKAGAVTKQKSPAAAAVAPAAASKMSGLASDSLAAIQRAAKEMMSKSAKGKVPTMPTIQSKPSSSQSALPAIQGNSRSLSLKLSSMEEGSTDTDGSHLEDGFFCKYCYKSFTRKRNCNRHEQRMHGDSGSDNTQLGPPPQKLPKLTKEETPKKVPKEKPYECLDCGRCFCTQQGLDIHSRSHRPEAPYVCEHCNTHFKYKQACTNHVRRLHSEN